MSDLGRALFEALPHQAVRWSDLTQDAQLDWARREVILARKLASSSSIWEPMASAPRDGTHILCLFSFGPEVVAWKWGGWWHEMLLIDSNPIGWCALPDAPYGEALQQLESSPGRFDDSSFIEVNPAISLDDPLRWQVSVGGRTVSVHDTREAASASAASLAGQGPSQRLC